MYSPLYCYPWLRKKLEVMQKITSSFYRGFKRFLLVYFERVFHLFSTWVKDMAALIG
jgi:hypothetical protein